MSLLNQIKRTFIEKANVDKNDVQRDWEMGISYYKCDGAQRDQESVEYINQIRQIEHVEKCFETAMGLFTSVERISIYDIRFSMTAVDGWILLCANFERIDNHRIGEKQIAYWTMEDWNAFSTLFEAESIERKSDTSEQCFYISRVRIGRDKEFCAQVLSDVVYRYEEQHPQYRFEREKDGTTFGFKWRI